MNDHYAKTLQFPVEFLTRQLIAKLADKAQEWYHLYFANQTSPVTTHDIRIGIRATFGFEYSAYIAYLDIFRTRADYS